MSGHTHKGWYDTGPARPEKPPEEVDTCLSTRAALSWSAPRSQVVGSCRSQGPGYERSPVPTPLISTTRQTCSFRFLKQNPPLKMYLQTFLCHRLILDIARICTFPGLAAPSPGGAALEQTLVAPEPTASAACPTEPCQALGPVASAHQGQTATFFQNLDVGCCSGKCPVGTGPAGPARPQRCRSIFRRAWETPSGDPGASSSERPSREKGQIPPHGPRWAPHGHT